MFVYAKLCGYREHILHWKMRIRKCWTIVLRTGDLTNDSLIHTIMTCAVEYWLPNAPVVLFCFLINRPEIVSEA